MPMSPQVDKALSIFGRILLSAVFLIEGWSKVQAFAPSQGYMAKYGVPGALLPAVILLEIGGAAMIILGWQSRLAALALAGFCVAAAYIFHTNFADRNHMLHFWKDIGLAGGFLVLAAHGSGAWSVDRLSQSQAKRRE